MGVFSVVGLSATGDTVAAPPRAPSPVSAQPQTQHDELERARVSQVTPATAAPELAQPGARGSAASVGGVAGQSWTASQSDAGLVITVDGTAKNPGQVLLNGVLRLPADVYFQGVSRLPGAYRNVTLKLPIPEGASAAQTAQSIADAVNLEADTRLFGVVNGASVTLIYGDTPQHAERRIEAQKAAAARYRQAEDANAAFVPMRGHAGPSVRAWLAQNPSLLDPSTRRLLSCMDKGSAGFTRGAGETLLALARDCGASSIQRVNAVGRALGSQELRAPGNRIASDELVRDHGVVRRLMSFFPESGLIAFVGFSPAKDAAGAALPYGRFEIIAERARPNALGEFADFFVIDTTPLGAKATEPPPTLCLACHQGGVPIFPKLPWREIEDKRSPISGAAAKAYYEAKVSEPYSTARDLPLTSAGFFEFSGVLAGAQFIHGKRWVHRAGLADFHARKALASVVVDPESAEAVERRWKRELERRVAPTIAGDPQLVERHVDDPVPLIAGHDPLLPRPPIRYGFAWAIDALWGSRSSAPGPSGLSRDIRQAAGAERIKEFMASRALADELVERWPPLPADLLAAAKKFAADPTPADEASYVRRVANEERARRAREQAAPEPGYLQNANDVLNRYCVECHSSGGLVPALDPKNLHREGKYPSTRSIEQMLDAGLMPPKTSDGVHRITPEAIKLLRDALRESR